MPKERQVRKFSYPLALVLVAAGFISCAVGQTQTPDIQELSTFPRTTLEVLTKPQPQRFNVWIADTPDRQAQGLMFVRDLPADEGMIFIKDKPSVSSMWMKNTYIELDMLFVAPDGRIAKIAERTVPHSLNTINSGVPIIAVVELKGGEAARRSLKVGDRVEWKSKAKG
jgi:uncharacterized protein